MLHTYSFCIEHSRSTRMYSNEFGQVVNLSVNDNPLCFSRIRISPRLDWRGHCLQDHPLCCAISRLCGQISWIRQALATHLGNLFVRVFLQWLARHGGSRQGSASNHRTGCGEIHMLHWSALTSTRCQRPENSANCIRTNLNRYPRVFSTTELHQETYVDIKHNKLNT